MSDPVAEAFEAQRDRLRAVAYRVLGSHADAEDAVQEAWLRLARQNSTTIGNLAGWLTTVVGRISLDVLRSRRAHPETPDGLSEFVVTVDDTAPPDEQVELADSVGLALLVVLDSLGPDERLAFVLHDLFAVPFAEIGRILGKSADATKMIASRARRKVRATDRPTAVRGHREVVHAFRAAVVDGDFEALLRVLHPDVELTVDTPGGVVVTLGATAVATGARSFGGATVARYQAVLVDGRPGYLAWRADGTPISLASFTVADGRITAIAILADPARLAALSLIP
ncbi:sigma-70 family RNA polymerase sigma factor [Umezawaea sp. NPDC059074]|uniref:sigma-70 family RNA polymerase sigma factor n=1 Tax=Umezawaea sp. NPDC059074 TaxID=3346716 RepID=UPI00367AE2A6